MGVPQIFSLDTWRRLSDDERSKLTALLPDSCKSAAEAEQVLQTELFAQEPRRFGVTLSRFWDRLQAGAYGAEQLAADAHADARHSAAYTELQRTHHNALVHKLHQLKRTWKSTAPRAPSQRSGGGGGGAGDQLIYSKQSGGLVRRTKTGGVGVPLGRPCLGETRGLGGTGPAAAGGGAAGGGGESAAGSSEARMASSLPAGRGGGQPTEQQQQQQQQQLGMRGDGDAAMLSAAGGQDGGGGDGLGAEDDASMCDVFSSPGDPDAMLSSVAGVKRPRSGEGAGGVSPSQLGGAVPNPYFDTGGGGGGGEDDGDVSCPPQLRFFELVRDAISSVQQALAPAEYVKKQVAIQAQAAGMIAKLPRGTVLAQYVRSVLFFMTTPAACHAARTSYSAAAAANDKAVGPPPAALVHFDEPTQSFRWLGSAEDSSSAALRRLEALHYDQFLAQHGGVVGAGGARGLHAAPKAQKSMLTLPPGSAEQLATFRTEEERRYAAPERAFTYTLRDGSTSCVAPLRDGSKKGGGKARDHFLLVPERPNAATLLSLVRDAAARLPGGEGSRTDVCELLKESAYVTDGVNDAQISAVASGTLDRLHQEADPCVRYDAERKLWIYLHGARSEASFDVA